MIKLSELTDDQLIQIQNEIAAMNNSLAVKFIIQIANGEIAKEKGIYMAPGTVENMGAQNMAKGRAIGILDYSEGFGLLDKVTEAIEERKRKRGQ
jgi:hypothetical protein